MTGTNALFTPLTHPFHALFTPYSHSLLLIDFANLEIWKRPIAALEIVHVTKIFSVMFISAQFKLDLITTRKYFISSSYLNNTFTTYDPIGGSCS